MKFVNVPPSKSISNRALVLAFINRGSKIIRNVLKCDDTAVVIEAFRILGVSFEVLQETERDFDIEVRGFDPSNSISAELNLQNAGTAVRFLIPALCNFEGEFTVTGSERMLERPIGDLIDALKQLGAKIEYLGVEGFLPVKIFGGASLAGVCKVKCDISSQFLSGLMILNSSLLKPFEIQIDGNVVSKPYIKLTKDVIAKFSQSEFIVEGDASSASYFFAMGALKYPVTVINVLLDTKQADIKFLDALVKMGVRVEGNSVFPSELRAIELNCEDFPDSAMTLAILCAVAPGRSVLTGLSNLKFKECNRLCALQTELGKVGVEVEVLDDGLVIHGIDPAQCKSALIETYNDHRIAMCFAVLRLIQHGIQILGQDCVAKTYPTFWKEFDICFR